MRRNPYFSIQHLEGVPYLLPFGQAVADHLQGVRLDETGVFLWEALEDAPSREVLLERFLAFAQPAPEELDQAAADLNGFLDQMVLYRMAEEQKEPREGAVFSFRIAGMELQLRGDPAWIPEELEAFRTEAPGPADQVLTLTDREPALPPEARLVLRSAEVEILQSGQDWVLLFPAESRVRQGVIRQDGREGTFFLRPGYTPERAAQLREELFHAMRPVFLLRARGLGIRALHGVSIGYRDRAWIFSAPSGTGKSTHAKLWEEAFGVGQINGDLALLAFRDEKGRETPGTLWLLPGPWCGTSGIFTTRAVTVGGITLLARDTKDELEPLAPDRKQLLLANRLVSPFWTREMLEDHLAFAGEVTRQVPLWRLHCTKNPSAAQVMKDAIDRWVEGT